MVKVPHIARASLLILSVQLLAACNHAASSESVADHPAAVTNAAPVAAKPVAEVVKPACDGCGTVKSITPVRIRGESSGMGAALGAIAGGLVGHQVGGGTGKNIATVAGVVGGAVAGNNIEKNRNTEHQYKIGVELENGEYKTVTVGDASGISLGAAVIVEGSNIRLR